MSFGTQRQQLHAEREVPFRLQQTGRRQTLSQGESRGFFDNVLANGVKVRGQSPTPIALFSLVSGIRFICWAPELIDGIKQDPSQISEWCAGGRDEPDVGKVGYIAGVNRELPDLSLCRKPSRPSRIECIQVRTPEVILQRSR